MQSESHAPRRLLTRAGSASISRDIPRYFVKQSRVINPTILPSPPLSLSKRVKITWKKKRRELRFDPSALNFNILIRSRYISSRTLRISIP